MACALVFAVHFGQRIYFVGPLKQLTDFGGHGVRLFFIVSGFLIAHSCDLYARKQTGRYILKRMIKIAPLYYVVITYYFVVHALILRNVPEDPTGFGWLRYLLFLNNIVPPADMYFWDNLGITWTIPYFVVAYVVFSLLLKVVDDYRKSVLLFAGSLLLSGCTAWLNGWLQILNGMPAFALGIVLFFCFKEKKQMCTSIGLCILILYQLIYWRVSIMLYAYIFALMIIATETISFEDPRINKLLAFSDRYSYTLYLCHGIVFIHILDRYEFGRIPEAVIAIVGSAAVTYVVNRWIELPLQKKLLRRLQKTIPERKSADMVA